MCVLSHCIEKAYGLYDVNRPEESPKISTTVISKLKNRPDVIGADWEYCIEISADVTIKRGLHIFGLGFSDSHQSTSVGTFEGGSGVTGAFGTEGQVIPEKLVTSEATTVSPR